MRVGLTGHQHLGSPEDVVWVTEQLRTQIESDELDSGVMSLAVGADQLYASLLHEHGKPYIAIIPCARYESTFTMQKDLKSYRALLAAASDVNRMPFGDPSETAFWEAGKRVVETSDYMIAVWNGLPAKGLGGTADVVRFCVTSGKRVVHVNPRTHTVEHLLA